MEGHRRVRKASAAVSGGEGGGGEGLRTENKLKKISLDHSFYVWEVQGETAPMLDRTLE